MPNNSTPALPEGTYSGGGTASLPSDEYDPVKSPDDPPPTESAIDGRESSSSFSGMDKILNPPDDQETGKHRKLAVVPPEHQETSAEDIEVGKYELDRKNWKAALSRFQSAMVLAPDDPEVYWGLAECARNMGHFADARGYYQKVVDYDPDSKHGKEARKLLKAPEIANAKATEPAPPGTAPAK
jgi:tetratricopeptide (TPR) repeat protein